MKNVPFNTQKEVVYNIIEQLNVAPNFHRLGLLTYGEQANVITHLKNTANMPAFREVLRRTNKPIIGKNIRDVLKKIKTMIEPNNGGRENSPKVIILFIDNPGLIELLKYKDDINRLTQSALKFVLVYAGQRYPTGIITEDFKGIQIVTTNEVDDFQNQNTTDSIIDSIKSGIKRFACKFFYTF